MTSILVFLAILNLAAASEPCGSGYLQEPPAVARFSEANGLELDIAQTESGVSDIWIGSADLTEPTEPFLLQQTLNYVHLRVTRSRIRGGKLTAYGYDGSGRYLRVKAQVQHSQGRIERVEWLTLSEPAFIFFLYFPVLEIQRPMTPKEGELDRSDIVGAPAEEVAELIWFNLSSFGAVDSFYYGLYVSDGPVVIKFNQIRTHIELARPLRSLRALGLRPDHPLFLRLFGSPHVEPD